MKILIEGPDKTGKDLLRTYIKVLSNYKYVVDVRGEISCLVYDAITDRFTHERHESFFDLLDHNKLYVFLDAEEDDLKVRAKVTNHEKVDWKRQKEWFNFYYNLLRIAEYKTIKYNTSKMTMYQIAKDIIYRMEILCK